MINKLRITLALMALAASGVAQQPFKYKAQLPKPKTSDFYIISLNERVLACSNADLSDIRLMDAKGNTVPYIFGSNLPAKRVQQLIIFKRIIKPETDTATTFVVENDGNSMAISQLLLKLRNTAAERTADLAGSDDLENWFAIIENITLQKAGETANTDGVYEQMLSFPSSNYRYFRIRVNNKHRDPIAILQAGIYDTQRVAKPAYELLPGTQFAQKDTGRVSRVFIKLADDYPVNQLHLVINGTRYYKRGIKLYEVKGTDRNMLMEGFISSAFENVFRFSAKATAFEIEIENGDSPPITVNKLEAFMLQQSLIAYLDKDNDYHLIFGDTAAISPDYDLKFFKDSLQHTMPILLPGNVQKNRSLQTPVTKAISLPAWAIWIAIAAVLTLLIFLTVKMTREVKNRV